MYDTIRVLSAGLSLHTWARDGLVYVFAGQRTCDAFGTVIPSAVLCVVIVVSTVVLATEICTAW